MICVTSDIQNRCENPFRAKIEGVVLPGTHLDPSLTVLLPNVGLAHPLSEEMVYFRRLGRIILKLRVGIDLEKELNAFFFKYPFMP